MARTAHADLCPSTLVTGYQRRRPEQGALYQTVARYWPAFVERAEQAGGLPDFVKREDELVFHALPEPTTAEVAQLANRIAERAENVMRKHGRWVDTDSSDSEPDALSLEQPALSAGYQASAQGVDVLGSRAGRPTLCLVTTAPALNTYAEPGAVAVVRGFGLDWRLETGGCRF
jgi:hypothetical protein